MERKNANKKYKSITENKSENTAKYDFNIERRDNIETQSQISNKNKKIQ